MNTNKFKKILKESLSRNLTHAEDMCSSAEGINICDFLSAEKSQKLIDAGEILRTLPGDRQFTADDIKYIVQVIAFLKREYGDTDEEVLNYEAAVRDIMNIDGDIAPAMESLRNNFLKFQLG
tara:strand:- start:154 stop:519 length:366 start_codon:yes stop_codon:yes gene_type:complete